MVCYAAKAKTPAGVNHLRAFLRLMRDSGEEHIGVVESRQSMRLVGFLHQVDVMLAYNRALMAARREERGQA